MSTAGTNWDVAAARRYHERTKHSFISVRRGGRALDWTNRPNPFKEYVGVDPVPLPRAVGELGTSALAALAADFDGEPATLDLDLLAWLLRFGAGVVRTRTVPGGDAYHFRTYSSAGALYPVEVYVAAADVPGLPAGLYHFHPGELALRPLREADVRAALARAADAPELSEAGAVIVLTGILWRSAWKYGPRAYRHLYWDAGTLLANLLALAAAARLAPRLLTGFVDGDLNAVLGLDGAREAGLALLAVGRAERAATAERLEPLELKVAPLSRAEELDPEARALHVASTLGSADEVRRYRSAAAATGADERGPSAPGRTDGESLERVLRRRGSMRDFSPKPVAKAALSTAVALAARPLPADVPPCTELYGVLNAVEGLEAGTYRIDAPDRFELVAAGEFRRAAGDLVLGQELGARAAATLFCMTDLERVLAGLGNRGYRAAQLEAGVRVGRLYLAAYAQGLGATASTFYDDDVSRLLAPALTPLLCLALGRPPRRV